MLLLACLLVPMVLVAADKETIINNYIVKIIDATLISVQPTEQSSHDLNLSGLGLRVLKKEAFCKLPTLRTLDLTNNSLSDISKGAFSRPIALDHLSLSNNNISRFKYAFDGLNDLKTLNISNNPVDKLRSGEFYGLSKSCVIFTKGLSISTIDPRVFEKPVKQPYGMDEYNFEETKEREISSSDITDSSEEITFKICIQDAVVKLVGPTKENETLPSSCQLRETRNQGREMPLSNLGIAKFAKDWYRLEDTSIESIVLDKNRIVEITKEILNDLPTNIRIISLAKNKIEHLKKGIIENKYIWSLALSLNAIREIEKGAFAEMALAHIFLDSNRLKDTSFVDSLPATVDTIELQRNEIAEITPGSFSNAGQLTYLGLDRNLIRKVKENSLHGLQNLTSLYLDNNRISKIHPECFRHTPKLANIGLANNSIVIFEKGLFDNLRNLEYLFIHHNELSNIKDNFPDGLPPSLEQLRLDFNKIEKLERGTFINVPKTKLSLNGNKISQIEPGSFDLPSLRTLNLNNNNLIELDADSFLGLNDIETLSLRANGITKIPKGFTKHFRHLKVLQLGSNPIKRLENGTLPGIRSSFCKIVVYVKNAPIEVIEGGLFDDT